MSYPTAANTGWQHTGVTLRDSGPITVTQNGAVIDSLNVTGCIVVQADNVTIKRSKINATCNRGIEVQDWQGYTGLLIEDVEISGNSSTDDCIAFSGYTARRVNLHNCFDGAKIGDSTVIENSYIHDLVNANGCHCDGVQSTGGYDTILRGNNIDVPGAGAAIMLGDEFDQLGNITIDGNRINGGNYGLYGGWNSATGSGPASMRVTNNGFGSNFTYGTHVYVGPSAVWSGNVKLATGQIVNR